MSSERIIRILAGALVLTGTALAFFLHQPWWLVVPAFVGTNLLQSAFTGFCPAEKMAVACGARPCCDRN